MGFPINRVARGLLSLLDTQSQGQNPNQLGTEIVPTLDMVTYLAASKGIELAYGTATSAIAIGTPVLLTDATTGGVYQVPNDEIWLARHCSVFILNNDGAISIAGLRMQAIAIMQGARRMPLMAGSASETIVAGGQMSRSVHFGTPLVFPSGTAFAFLPESLTAFAGADPGIVIAMHITRLIV